MTKESSVEPLAAERDFATPLLQVIESLLAEIKIGTRPETIGLDSSLDRDLGLDSLARVELMARIERHFSLALPERVFAEAETPRDLIRELVLASVHAVTPATVEVRPLQRDKAITYPYSARTLIEVLEWHVQSHPQRAHIQFYTDKGDGELLDYQSLYDGAQAVAAGLQKLGLLPGEVVTIMLPTSKEYFYSFFGILLAGGIPVPIYPPARPTQLEDHLRRHTRILSNCRAVSMITVTEAKRVALILKSQLETLQHIITVDELLAAKVDFIKPAIATQDTAFLQYTSGSTGTPKGVVLSHANLLANIRAMGDRVQANSSDVFVSWLPLYHDMGLIGAWLGSLYYGALLVVMSPLSFLARPQRWLQAIHRYHGTLSAAPNFGYELCMHRLEDADLEGLDLSSWRAAFNGAEAVSPGTVTQFPERLRPYGFRGEAMMPVYGLAESSVGLAFPPLGQGVRIDRIRRQAFMSTGNAMPSDADDANALQFVACGQALPGHEIRIIDEQGNELPERQQGRLQFNGPSATSGYLHNREANEKLFDGEWLDSGDLAYLSEGDLFVTGRTKDIIIRAGRNLYPHELEEAVGDVPEIRKGRVAVFGATSPKSGTERLVVLAETRKKDASTRAQLRAQVNVIASEVLGEPADDVVLARPNTVLKTSSGKIRRSACRELYESGFIGKMQVPVWRQISRLLLTSVQPQLRRLRKKIATRLWAMYAKAVFWLLAPLTWLLVVISPWRVWRWKIMQLSTRALMWVTACPLRVEGRDRLPEPAQACIYVANHASFLDGPLMIAALRRSVSFVAKEALQSQLIAGTFLRRIDAEFVERFDAKKGVEDIRRIADSAHAGPCLAFFPEGTFTRNPGLLPFHLGAFLTAVEAGLPVVPVAIRGTRSILRGNSRLPHLGSVTIVIGDPIFVNDLPCCKEESESWSLALGMRDAARGFILRHCGEPDLAHEQFQNIANKPLSTGET